MQEDKKLLRYSFGVCDQMKKDNYYLENYSNNLSMQPEEVRSITARVKSNIKQYENQLLQNSQGKKGKDLMKFIGNVKNVMKQQGDQGQSDFLYQQQRMQAQEQIDDEDIEFYHDYFPNSMIDPSSNYEQQLIEQFAKMQTFSQNNNAYGGGEFSNNYLSLTNNTSNLNFQNMAQTPTTPQQGSAPAFQSSHSQEQLIKHHKEFLEAQKNKQLSLSQSQKYFNQKQDEQILPQSVTRQRDIDNDLFGINSINNNNSAHQIKLMRNHSSLETSTNILGSAKGVRNAHSGMSTNNILNGKNEVSYISDYQNNHMIQENMNDSLKIEDEIQPIPNEGDMKYEDQSYLDSYLLYKNSISQLNCAEDINLEDNQQQGSMVFYNNLNPNYILNAQSTNDHSQANGAQYQKYYLNSTNFLQNMDEYDGNNEPQLPQSCLPHFVNAHVNYEGSNLNFNEENVYLEEKYVQDMLYMRRPNSANYLMDNMEQSSNHIQKENKQIEKRKTFIESTKTNIPNAAKAKERSITHNTSFEQKIKNLQNSNKTGYQQQLQKTNSFKVQANYEKDYKMVNKENNLSQTQLNIQKQQARDKSNDLEKVDQNAVKIGKFISKRYVNKENKKPATAQLSYKTPETALRANEDFLNQKTKNYLEILKKHLRTDQINTANKTQKHTLNQVQTNTTQYQQPQQAQAKIAPKVNSTNNTYNKNNSPTKRLSNIYKINRNQPAPAPLPLYNTNDPSSANQTMTTAATITPTLRQNHSFVVTQKKGDENQETKQEIAKSIGVSNQNQQKKQDLVNPYNINMKNVALTRYNKTANNTIQNTLRTNRNTKEELTNKNMTNHNQFTNANNLATVLFNATQAVAQPVAKKNPIPTSQNATKQAQPYVPSTQKPSSSSAAQQLFDDININNFKFEQEIGKGSYATVKLAIDRASQIRYALKIYPRFVLLDPHKMRNVKREIAILRKLQHPFIIKMPFAIEDKQNQIIVGMEYVGKQSLHGYLKTKSDRKLEEPEVKRLFRQIVEGVNYCHKMSVVHRDIKLENILLDQSNNIKIIDFGFSIINGEDKKLKIFCGTPSYMAPEIVSKIEYVGQKADIWALGILLFVMLQGKFPFKGVNDNELFKKIKKGAYTFTHPVSSDAEKLISQLLNIRPSERPNLPTILEHSWFSQQN